MIRMAQTGFARIARRLHRIAGALAGLALLAGAAGLAAGQSSDEAGAPVVLVTDITGAIGPPTTRQITELIEAGEDQDAEIVILRMDTPGGLTTSTREINKAILASGVPVAVFVAPPGARAASAGTYILYASHVAAMAPGTNLGAATPVQMGGGSPGGENGDAPSPAEDGAEDKPADEEAPAQDDALANKAVNDAVAQIRSLAEMRGRNADWAEKAVREAASLSASAALERNVIEFVAGDVRALLDRMDGHTVTVGEEERILATADATVRRIEPSVVTRLLGVLSNPNVALLLMTIGFYGLIFELSSPGLGPGIPGAISLLLGLYALNMLPIDYAGLALIVFGLALMAAEAVTPAFGVLGVGGAVSFGIGATMLIDTDAAQYQISTGVIVTIALLSLLIVTLVVGAIWRTGRAPPQGGADAMVGASARVIDWRDGHGDVRAHGERWRARGPDDLSPGDTVEIVGVEGLTLILSRPGEAGHQTPEEAP